MKHSLQYLFYGLLSNAAIRLYYLSPREILQDEFMLAHRYFLKKAHTARMRGEHERRKNGESESFEPDSDSH